MQVEYSIISVIDILGCLQGIILGSILLYTSYIKRRETYFLGLFVFVYAHSFIPMILEHMKLDQMYPQLSVMPRLGEWLLTSIFLVYIQKVSIFSDRKIAYRSLYPGIFMALLQSVIFMLPVATKISLSQTIWYKLLFLAGFIYSTAILVYTWRFLEKHSQEVENQYSMVAQKQLSWAKRFVLFGFALFVLHFARFFTDTMEFRIIYACANVFMIYWASIHGIMQPKVLSLVNVPDIKNESDIKEKAITVFSGKEREQLVEKINDYISKSEAFIHSDLTIVELANDIGVHPRRISAAINSVLGQNFNSYINQFRIKKAMLFLNEQKRLNLSIEGIGTKVGFNSKSAFYSAFKKETGSTPTRYREAVSVGE